MQLSNQENEYYNRQIILNNFGIEAQYKLKQARVLVVGAGGLGCPVLQYLTAAGIGNIGIIDGDTISISNLHRQILFSINDIGQKKAVIAKEKLMAQNPNISITVFDENITIKNAIDLIEQYDIIADCTDNFATRYLINDACVIANKPFASASILKFEGQLSVFNYKTKINYRDVFPEPPTATQNCAEAGVIGVLCGIIGSMQANEIIKLITGIGETLEGKLLCYDALTNKTQSFNIKPSNVEIKMLQNNYDFSCETKSNKINEISVQELKNKMDNDEDFQLIDVREQQEFDYVNINGELIPLATILENQEKISKTKPVIIHCKSGVRSAKAIALLEQNGFTNLYNLKGGILAYVKEIDTQLPLY